MVTLMKGLLLDEWSIMEYVNTVVVLNPSQEKAFTITHEQLNLLKQKILLLKTIQPTRNHYKLMPITKAN